MSGGSIHLGERSHQALVYVTESLSFHSIASDVDNDFLLYISVLYFSLFNSFAGLVMTTVCN